MGRGIGKEGGTMRWNFTEVYEKVMETSREGKREKTMIEKRRGREREAEEEAEVRKQGEIGGGRS